jgi:hypothetical protein
MGWRAELKGRGGCWLRVYGLSRQQATNGRDYSTSVNKEHVPQTVQSAANSRYGLLDLKWAIAKSAAGWTARGTCSAWLIGLEVANREVCRRLDSLRHMLRLA